MKRCLTILLAAGLLLSFVGLAHAKQGMPSQATLSAMGLSDMQVMSDREAMDVRGFGYRSSKSKVVVFGSSYAHIGGHHDGRAGSVDGYYAEGKHHASGEHGSHAGKVEIVYEKGGRKDRGHRGGGKRSYGKGGGKKDRGHRGGGKQSYGKGGGKKDRGHHGGGKQTYGKGGGHKNGSHGGSKRVKVKSTKVFAGGYAHASAY